MRLKVKCRQVVVAACLLSATWLGSCSSSQQDDEDLAAQNGSEDVAGQDGADSQSADGADKGDKTDELAGSEGKTSENSMAQATPQNSTDGDLKEIISEMNSANAETAGDPKPEEATATQEATAQAAPAADGNKPSAPAAETAAASATVNPAGLPEMGSKMAYFVEHGDTLGKIAQKIYGNQARWKDIANLSSLSNPSRIYPGDVVYYALDEASMSFAKANESVARSSETVQSGDTLAKIAKRVYGTSRSWKHIWRQNDSIDNPDRLTAGTTVYYVQKGAISAQVKKLRSNTANLAVNLNLKTQKIVKNLTRTTFNGHAKIFSGISFNANATLI